MSSRLHESSIFINSTVWKSDHFSWLLDPKTTPRSSVWHPFGDPLASQGRFGEGILPPKSPNDDLRRLGDTISVDFVGLQMQSGPHFLRFGILPTSRRGVFLPGYKYIYIYILETPRALRARSVSLHVGSRVPLLRAANP